jgi:acetoacetyl-CoA reductase
MSRIALVTGGTRGIGEAIAKSLQAAGHTVVATWTGNDAAANAFKDSTGMVIKRFDVGDFAATQTAIAEVEQEVGPVDILVNNAGITKDGFLHKMSFEQWDAVMKTNLYSAFNCTRAVMPGMRARSFGRVINISSINGAKGQLGQTNYAAAKAGMIGFAKALAFEGAAKGITANTIAPGYIETAMTAQMEEKVLAGIVRQIPAGRLGQPTEIGSMVNYLASDEAGFINGATFHINGAQYIT